MLLSLPRLAVFLTILFWCLICPFSLFAENSRRGSVDLCSSEVERKRNIPKEYLDVLNSPHIEYLVGLKKKMKKKFHPINVFEKIFREYRFDSVPDRVDVVIGLDVSSSGAIEKTQIFCSSMVSPFNEEVLKTFERIKSFSKPPATLLNKNDFLKMAWTFTVYLRDSLKIKPISENAEEDIHLTQTKQYKKDLKKYVERIKWRIMGKWVLPEEYTNAKGKYPVAKIVLRITQNGEIISTAWNLKSGFSDFDDSCLSAVHDAAPFPLPPDELRLELFEEGFLIQFDPWHKPTDAIPSGDDVK